MKETFEVCIPIFKESSRNVIEICRIMLSDFSTILVKNYVSRNFIKIFGQFRKKKSILLEKVRVFGKFWGKSFTILEKFWWNFAEIRWKIIGQIFSLILFCMAENFYISEKTQKIRTVGAVVQVRLNILKYLSVRMWVMLDLHSSVRHV